jgi:hypothetical protein
MRALGHLLRLCFAIRREVFSIFANLADPNPAEALGGQMRADTLETPLESPKAIKSMARAT